MLGLKLNHVNKRGHSWPFENPPCVHEYFSINLCHQCVYIDCKCLNFRVVSDVSLSIPIDYVVSVRDKDFTMVSEDLLCHSDDLALKTGHLFYVIWFLPEASFGLQVLSLAASVCLCVCVCGNHLLVRAITCHPFKLEPPNLDQKNKTPWLRSLLFWGVIDFELQGQI